VGNIKRILAQNQKLPVKTFSAAVFAEDYFKQHFEINPVARLSIVTARNNAAILDTDGNTCRITAAGLMALHCR
jgi:hypothetical protein